MKETSATVLIEPTSPHVTTLRLNRPEQLNALNYTMVAALHDALDEVAADDDCRVVILSGAGRGFCAGLTGTDVGISYFLPRLIGAARAFDVILTGRTIDAVEADRMGLVSRVYADDELGAGAQETAEQVAGYTAFGLRRTKEVLWHNLEASSVAAAIAMENRNQELAVHEPEVLEYMQTYAQRHQR